MPKIEVIDHVSHDITQERNEDDEWSRDSTSESHYITGIRIGKGYGDVECSFNVLPNTNYYLLYYIYSTGDSFGSDEGRIEFVGLYEDETLARRSADAMEAAAAKNQCTVQIWNEDGTPYEEFLSCVNDYFGSFDGASVDTVQLI